MIDLTVYSDRELTTLSLQKKENSPIGQDTPLGKARRRFYHHCAKLEQAEAQRRPPTMEARLRMEFEAVIDILKAYGVEP